MSCQQRTGLALLSNMDPKSNFANIIPCPRCQLSGTEDRALRLPVAPRVLIAGALNRSAKKRHSKFDKSRGGAQVSEKIKWSRTTRFPFQL